MQEILHATTTSPPPVTSYGDRAGMPRCESAWRKSRDDTGPMPRTDCRVGVPLLSGIIKSMLLMMMHVLMGSAPSHAQQIAMMTYERRGGTTNQYGEIFVDDLSTSHPSPSTVAFSLAVSPSIDSSTTL